MGQLREDGAQRLIATPRAAGSLLAGTFVVPGSHPNPSGQAAVPKRAVSMPVSATQRTASRDLFTGTVL
jgi:hypothetical protein